MCHKTIRSHQGFVWVLIIFLMNSSPSHTQKCCRDSDTEPVLRKSHWTQFYLGKKKKQSAESVKSVTWQMRKKENNQLQVQ